MTKNDSILTRYLRCGIATDEGIAGVSFRARAGRRMIDHSAARQEAARPWTGISTLFPDAGSIGGTVRVDRTFGSTIGRDADVILHAAARRYITDGSTQGIRSAG